MVKKKRVVYLFGTGASQANLSLSDDTITILMDDIREGIRKGIDDIREGIRKDKKKSSVKDLFPLINELSGIDEKKVDVEQLITLYDSSGTRKHSSIAKKLKELFREEIQKRIKKLDEGRSDGTRFLPLLYSALIDMYNIKGIDEKLKGIITLNYEDLIERAIQKVKGSVNYSISLKRKRSLPIRIKGAGIPILKLHGSFNWKNEYPISIDYNLKEEDDMLWIPPGVEKQSERYPFNVIWGKAKELLDCDILRIVGCSLSRNDWHLVSLLYNTKKLNSNGKEYVIEIIDRPSVGNDINNTYPHLGIKPIDQIPEVRKYVSESLVSSSSVSDNVIKDSLEANYVNVFEVWLRAKGEDMIKRDIKIETSKHIFRNYMYERGL